MCFYSFICLFIVLFSRSIPHFVCEFARGGVLENVFHNNNMYRQLVLFLL